MEECFKPATLLKVTLLHGRFSRFLNCTNGTKSRKIYKLNLVIPLVNQVTYSIKSLIVSDLKYETL